MQRNNNFNLLRLIAASAVIFSHSYPLSGIDWEPLAQETGISLGGFAVKAFFAISGYFILASFDRRKSDFDFWIARGLRLVPALALMGVVVGIILPPLMGAAPSVEYAVKALTVILPIDQIPGLFADNPSSRVNGSLWTLFFEVACYAMLFLTGVSGLRLWLALGLMLALSLVEPRWPGLMLPFVIGMVVRRLGNDGRLCAALVGGALVSSVAGYQVPILWTAAIALGTLWLGFQRQVLNVKEDYSYGIYIYGWPAQQTVIALFPELDPLSVSLAALSVALVLGGLSWHLLEKPALQLREFITTARLTAG